ncbi:hypothetical protein [Muricoccus nepalensis]|uniref:hypothetical protein n=1 Tax=Muricoccus nepalensis TaxID=1854500 RepID=UPI0011276FA0|nr:hypothetical protein [Roseomonas nepalensis]
MEGLPSINPGGPPGAAAARHPPGPGPGCSGGAPGARPDLDARLGGAAPDRLSLAATAYMLLPALVFLGGWGAAWVAVAGVAAGALALARLPGWRGGWPLPAGRSLALLALGLAWAGTSGAHHLVYSPSDWQIRDAVLHDLSTGSWPVLHRHLEDGTAWLLRAPLGYYMPAGLVGRLAGLRAAEAALWAWTGLGLGLVLALLADLARAAAPGRRGAFAVMAGLFAVFGGLDILPNMWLDGTAGAGVLGSWGRGGEWWPRLFQYSGHVTAVLWVPNHALPAWLPALLLLRHGRDPAFLRGVAVLLAGAAFWSPVSAAGAALLAGVAALRQGWAALRGSLLAAPNLLAVALALPVCLYLVAGSAAVPHGFLLALHPPGKALATWAFFLVVEVLCWAVPAAMLVRSRALGVAVALLCLLPAYVFGPGNEMTARGGMVPLAVLAVVAGAALLAPAPDRRRRLARGALIACALLGAAGSAMEGSLLVTHRPWPASTHCSFPEAARQSVFADSTEWAHYVAPWPEPALGAWMREPAARPVPPPGVSPPCWPGGGP